jgi:hypothetical protein
MKDARVSRCTQGQEASAMPSGEDPSQPPMARIALHAVLAGVFFFVLQRFALGQSMETALLWAVLLGAGAGWLAWSQSRR